MKKRPLATLVSERSDWCPVHWRNCSKPLHLCGNILLLKGWALYPRNGDTRFPETGWTGKPSLPLNFYLFLINWCHLVSLNCSIFPSPAFSWAWFTWKAWLSLTEPLAHEEILQQRMFGVIFIPPGVLLMEWIIDPDPLWITDLCWGSKFFHPQ